MTTLPLPPFLRAPTLILFATAALTACGGGSGGDGIDSSTAPPAGPNEPVGVPVPVDTGAPDDDVGTDPDPVDDEPASITGDIALYGVVAVGDEAGDASGDALASFSRLSTRVDASAFGAALSPTDSLCTVERDDGRPDLMSLSRLYLPVPDAASLEAIDAGESVLLSSGAGDSWIELQARPSDVFYTQPFDQGSPDGAVPTDLTANITGAAFPAFVDAALPGVTPLAGVAYDGDGNITPDTRFTWEAGGSANTRVRIESATDGGFFLGASTSVSCLVPDTGSFEFSPETRAELGTDFDGAEPDFSRIAIDSVQQDDALLVLVRESFVR